jgi:N-dimethylarginine dimethylaminohydrolase
MGATFLMSYPASDWQILGGENFRSKGKAATNPQAAMREWLRLCDKITDAGGRILVLPPTDPALTGMIFTANLGALFKQGDHWSFLLSKMSVAHRQGEREHVRKFLERAGVPCAEAKHPWEGQADVITLPGNKFIVTWGVRSSKEALEEVRNLLPSGARVLDVKLKEPFFHGDTCLDAITNRGGDTVLLAHGGGMVSRTVPELRTFLGNYGEVLSIDEDDALAYACNSLSVNGTLLVPSGLSTGLRGSLIHRGFNVQELDFPELFGKGGGGPRCLVNQLTGFVLTEEAPSYATERQKLELLADRYPESVAQKIS